MYPTSNSSASLVCLHSFFSLGESLGIPVFLFFSDLRFLTWQIRKSIDNRLKKTIDSQSMIINCQSIVHFQSIGNWYPIFYETSIWSYNHWNNIEWDHSISLVITSKLIICQPKNQIDSFFLQNKNSIIWVTITKKNFRKK